MGKKRFDPSLIMIIVGAFCLALVVVSLIHESFLSALCLCGVAFLSALWGLAIEGRRAQDNSRKDEIMGWLKTPGDDGFNKEKEKN
jgi:hypothetical protein